MEDTTKDTEEPNKSSRYVTRATTSVTTIEVDRATDTKNGNSNNNSDEERATLQKVLELLGEYRVEFQGLKAALEGQNEIICNQQETIRDLKEAAEKQQATIRELSQQLEDTKQQMGNALNRIERVSHRFDIYRMPRLDRIRIEFDRTHD